MNSFITFNLGQNFGLKLKASKSETEENKLAWPGKGDGRSTYTYRRTVWMLQQKTVKDISIIHS
jgi:hypothetical protein